MQVKKLNKEEISARIRQTLQRKGVKNKELAQRIGVSEVSISKWVTGVSVPKNDYIALIAAALGVSASWILTGEESSESVEQNLRYEVEAWKQRALEAESKLAILKGSLEGVLKQI